MNKKKKEAKASAARTDVAARTLFFFGHRTNMSKASKRLDGAYPADAVDRLRRKPYLADLPLQQLNVLGIGLGERVPQLFSSCALVSSSEGNLCRSLWRCGQVNVLDLDRGGGAPTAAAEEELEIVLSGQRQFGKPMRPSGLVSSTLLGRAYGRDDVTLEDRPHALIMAQPYSGAVGELRPVPPTAAGLA